MRKQLMHAGFYFDGLHLSPLATNKDILNRILDLRDEYGDDTEMQELLLNGQRRLTVEREKYEGEILPCLDYIRLLLRRGYGTEAEEAAIGWGLLTLKNIEPRLNTAPPRRVSDELLQGIVAGLKRAVMARDFVNKALDFFRNVLFMRLDEERVGRLLKEQSLATVVSSVVVTLEKALVDLHSPVTRRTTIDNLIKEGKEFLDRPSEALERKHGDLQSILVLSYIS